MSFASARKTLETVIETYATSKSYLVAWEGRQFERPAASQTYLAVYVKEQGGEQASLGDNPWYRREGFVQININVEDNKGRELADQVAQELCDLFRSEVFVDGTDTIECYVPDPKPVGVRDGKYIEILTIPFQRTSLT